MKEKMINLITEYSVLFWSFASFRIVVTLLITWLSSKYIPILVGKYLHKYPQVKRIIQKTGVTLIWMCGLLATLANAGVDVSAIITSLGLVGFAIGFALKDTVSNLISGVMIMLYSPFERGDVIEFGGKQGKVQWIDMKYTTLCEVVGMQADDIVLIPNQALFQKTIIVREKAKKLEVQIKSQMLDD